MAENDREGIGTGHVGIRTPHDSSQNLSCRVHTRKDLCPVEPSGIWHDVHNDAIKNITKK